MDKRSYLTKLIEPNEQFYMLLIDVMMYCKYKILNDETSANDSSIVDLLKKSKNSLIKLLHQPEYKSLMAQIALSEESKQKNNNQNPFTELNVKQMNSGHQGVKPEGALNEYENLDENQQLATAEDMGDESLDEAKPPSIDNFSQQANYSFEVGAQRSQNIQGLMKLISSLTMIGAMLLQVGASVECEECYVYYIAVIESIYGQNCLKLGQAYYLLGIFYDQQESFVKALICLMKSHDILKEHLGSIHKTVGDCLFAMALAQQYLKQAEKVYTEGIGNKNLRISKIFEEMGKINILRKCYNEAYDNLRQCLLIKKELFRYKPDCKEVVRVQRFIGGLLAILEVEGNIVENNLLKSKIKDNIEKEKSKDKDEKEKLNKINQILKKTDENSQKDQKAIKDEDKQLIDMIAKSLQSKKTRKVEDFVDEKILPKNRLEKLFNQRAHHIELDEIEYQILLTFSLLLTLNSQQKHSLVDINKVENKIPFLTIQFIRSLDQTQQTILLQSGLFYQKLNYNYVDNLPLLIYDIKKHCKNFFERSREEWEMEQMLVEIIQSPKMKTYNLNLTHSQLKAFESILKHELPLKFLIYMFEERQKKAILEMLFIAIFSDSSNEEAHECFKIFNLYIWYFHLFDDFQNEYLDKLFPKNQTDEESDFYHQLLTNLINSLQIQDKIKVLQINEKILNRLTFEQLLLYKQIKIAPNKQDQLLAFLNLMDEKECYQIYTDYIVNQKRTSSIKKSLKQLTFSTKYIFQIEIKQKLTTIDEGPLDLGKTRTINHSQQTAQFVLNQLQTPQLDHLQSVIEVSDRDSAQLTKEELILLRLNRLSKQNEDMSPTKLSGIQQLSDIGDNFGMRFLSSNYEEMHLLRDMNSSSIKEAVAEMDQFLLRQNESMKNLSKDSIMNINKKALDESSVNMSVYSRDAGTSILVNRLIDNRMLELQNISMRSNDNGNHLTSQQQYMSQLTLFNLKNDSFRGVSTQELDESLISARSSKHIANPTTKRISQGFDSFKKKNNMLVDEELRVFVGLYQKKDASLNFDKLKKSFLFMDENLVDYMRIFVLEAQGITDNIEEHGFSIVDFEKLKLQVPRLLTRVNTLFLEIHMIPLMKEIEQNCSQVLESVNEVVSNSVIVEKTITDIYNFIQRNKNQVSYMKPLSEMLGVVISPANERYINEYAFQRLDNDEFVRILNQNFKSLMTLCKDKQGNLIDEMSKMTQNFRIKIRELEQKFISFNFYRINIQAAFKDGDSHFCKKFTKLPKKGLKIQEKTTEILAKTKEDIKKLDAVFKAPQNINGTTPYNENARYENMLAYYRLLELMNKTLYQYQ
ncbi:tpr domain containing protein [Stylonychia lemnae]|uniref:Tpr domain containing protein n=1 Tax=Stylonychia lemnae TaxID=5949 RepID=A0A078A9H4_STYLE|nr:tpr domain containing protein [Stylonychia lemnae]|eukprot:CDW78864.1 tpr domain containing protein [Stylonychia lemnae]